MNTKRGLVIWTNAALEPAARARLEAGVAAGGHRLVVSAQASASVLAAAGEDPALAEADVAFGQPDAEACRRSKKLRWIALTSAGYTRYDNAETKDALRERGAVLTNASSVFAEPCAQHALAMMLGLSRQLPASLAEQLGGRGWKYFEHRAASRLQRGGRACDRGGKALGGAATGRPHRERVAGERGDASLRERAAAGAGQARRVFL